MSSSSMLVVMMVLEDSDEIGINYRGSSGKTPGGGFFFSASLNSDKNKITFLSIFGTK